MSQMYEMCHTGTFCCMTIAQHNEEAIGICINEIHHVNGLLTFTWDNCCDCQCILICGIHSHKSNELPQNRTHHCLNEHIKISNFFKWNITCSIFFDSVPNQKFHRWDVKEHIYFEHIFRTWNLFRNERNIFRWRNCGAWLNLCLCWKRCRIDRRSFTSQRLTLDVTAVMRKPKYHESRSGFWWSIHTVSHIDQTRPYNQISNLPNANEVAHFVIKDCRQIRRTRSISCFQGVHF